MAVSCGELLMRGDRWVSGVKAHVELAHRVVLHSHFLADDRVGIITSLQTIDDALSLIKLQVRNTDQKTPIHPLPTEIQEG